MALPRVRRRQRALLVAVIAGCCITALWFALVMMRVYRVHLQPRRVGLSEVTSMSGVAFPVSAQLVNSLYSPLPRGRRLWAEVAIPAADADAFMKGHEKQFGVVFADDKLAAVSKEPPPGWWPSEDEPAVVAVSDRAVGPKRIVYVSVNVGVVRGEPHRVLVYLYWTRDN